MITKDFIEKIANGTFSKNDVLIQSEVFPDKKDLLWDLWMADKACLVSTGKPQVTDEAQIARISKAIEWLSEVYEKDSPGEAEATTEPGEATLPEELASNRLAMELLEKCKEAGLLDENYMPIPKTGNRQGTTKWQKREIASYIIWLCGIHARYQWEPFKTFWNDPYLDKVHTPDLSKPESVNKQFLERKKIVDDIFKKYKEEKNQATRTKEHTNL